MRGRIPRILPSAGQILGIPHSMQQVPNILVLLSSLSSYLFPLFSYDLLYIYIYIYIREGGSQEFLAKFLASQFT